jgi:CDP-diacylglycerol--glycerol-3-phosphate 3-phosphatidyltransferase
LPCDFAPFDFCGFGWVVVVYFELRCFRNQVIKIKYAASLITIGRIIGAVVLLLTTPLSVLFFVIYSLCCVSDILDGYVARKTKATSKFGETLDSVADFIFIAIMFAIFVPFLTWEQWVFYWIGLIALIRFLSLGIGFAKYRALSFLHTYANKVTGIVLSYFPFLYWMIGITATAFVLCVIASLSALEELIITIQAKKLNRNVKGLFVKNDMPT